LEEEARQMERLVRETEARAAAVTDSEERLVLQELALQQARHVTARRKEAALRAAAEAAQAEREAARAAAEAAAAEAAARERARAEMEVLQRAEEGARHETMLKVVARKGSARVKPLPEMRQYHPARVVSARQRTYQFFLGVIGANSDEQPRARDRV
jgi:hypothetical protein